MLSVRKTDPRFTNFVPKTAEEAVDRFVRCRRNGLKAYLVPECLINCAQGLSATELNKFERYIINPNADLSNMEIVEQKAIRESNDCIFAENLKRVEAQLGPGPDEIPPLPMEVSSDDEKEPMEIETLTLQEPAQGMGIPSDR